jgi:hypothetical protein
MVKQGCTEVSGLGPASDEQFGEIGDRSTPNQRGKGEDLAGLLGDICHPGPRIVLKVGWDAPPRRMRIIRHFSLIEHVVYLREILRLGAANCGHELKRTHFSFSSPSLGTIPGTLKHSEHCWRKE